MKTRIALAQRNATVGDFANHVGRTVEAVRAADLDGVQLLVAPECTLSGYLPEVLLLRVALDAQTAETRGELAACRVSPGGPAMLVGQPLHTPSVDGNANRPIGCGAAPADTHNAAALIADGAVATIHRKQALLNTAQFGETRYAATALQICVFELNGAHFGMVFREDAWPASAGQLANAADTEATGTACRPTTCSTQACGCTRGRASCSPRAPRWVMARPARCALFIKISAYQRCRASPGFVLRTTRSAATGVIRSHMAFYRPYRLAGCRA